MFFCGCSLFTQLQTGEIFPHRQQFFIFSSPISSHLQLLAGKVSPLPTLPFLLPVLVQLVLAVRYLGALWRRLTRIWGQELNTGVNCEFTYMEHFLFVESKSSQDTNWSWTIGGEAFDAFSELSSPVNWEKICHFKWYLPSGEPLSHVTTTNGSQLALRHYQ